MTDVYWHSKVVVNVARDDFPQDANMRAFEAMAAGCLLISRVPSELTAIGFQEGIHFVAYRDENEIVGLVDQYLADNAKREQIACAGRQKVLSEHTYDCRAEQLMRTVEQHNGRLFAPARAWSEGQTRLAQLDYFAANAELGYACGELRRIARCDLRSAASGSVLVARALASKVRSRLHCCFSGATEMTNCPLMRTYGLTPATTARVLCNKIMYALVRGVTKRPEGGWLYSPWHWYKSPFSLRDQVLWSAPLGSGFHPMMNPPWSACCACRATNRLGG